MREEIILQAVKVDIKSGHHTTEAWQRLELKAEVNTVVKQ